MRRHQTFALLLSIAVVAGCQSAPPQAAPAAMPQADDGVQGTPVGDDRTAMEAAIDATVAPGAPGAAARLPASPSDAGGGHGVELAPNAPDSYTVKHGDTLWGIAKVFLKDPWYWPEIWQVNPQVHNPHLIYPGDTLRLVYINGRPQLLLQPGGGTERGNGARVTPRVRSQALEAAITTIPYETVAAFMNRPSVLEKEQIKHAPYVLATRDSHVVMADGDVVYARGFTGPVDLGMHYNLVRVGDPLRDPDDNNRILGYNGVYTGSGHVTRSGDPATLIMTESARETYPGDKLFPGGVDVPLDFIPSPPRNKIRGRIIAVSDGVTIIGQYQVVVINRGGRDGLTPGNVLAVYATGETIRDNEKKGFLSGMSSLVAPKVRLPNERTGTFMVFKTFDRMSFGLIMEANDIIHVADTVENP
jgi:LysM domain